MIIYKEVELPIRVMISRKGQLHLVAIKEFTIGNMHREPTEKLCDLRPYKEYPDKYTFDQFMTADNSCPKCKKFLEYLVDQSKYSDEVSRAKNLTNKVRVHPGDPVSYITNEDMVNEWGNHLMKSKADGTIDRYKDYLMILARYTNLPLTEIHFENVDEFLSQGYLDGDLKSLSTRRGHLYAFRKFYAWADANNYLPGGNPMESKLSKAFELPRLRESDKKERQPLTQSAIDRIDQYMSLRGNWRDYLIFRALLCTGGRKSEILSIQVDEMTTVWDDGKPIFCVVLHAKGGKIRRAFFDPELTQFVQKYIQQKSITAGLLFTTDTGRKIVPNYLNDVFKEVSIALEIPPFSPHQFRHNFITTAHQSDIKDTDIQKLVGHTNLQTTTGYIDNDENYMMSVALRNAPRPSYQHE